MRYHIKHIKTNCLLIIMFLLFSLSIYAQEAEPNDNIGDTNIFTIDTLGVYTGLFQEGGDIDLWYLAHGSYGDITLDVQFFANPQLIFAQINCNTGGYGLFGIDPNAVVVGTATPGSPANVTLDSTLYYTIFVADEFNNIDSTYTLILSGSGALPVELISFNFNVQNDGILLNWKTGTELNNYGFEIERINESETEDWKSISFINGNGTTNTPKEYFFFDERPPVGNLSYRLKQIDNNGSFEYSKSISVNIENPSSFKLFQNYPNPFNPATEIRFALNESDFVTLKVFDVQGNEVKNLVNGRKEAGIHRINFNAADISSGIYFYSIKTSSFSQTKKMMLIK